MVNKFKKHKKKICCKFGKSSTEKDVSHLSGWPSGSLKTTATFHETTQSYNPK